MRFLAHRWIKEQILLDSQIHHVLVLENPKFYRDFVQSLNRQIEDDEEFMVFQEDYKSLQLSKYAFLMTNLFDIPLDEKKCITLIYKDLEKTISENLRIALEKLNLAINSFVQDITYDYPIPLMIKEDITLSSIMKLAEVKPFYEPSDFLTALISRIKTLNFLMKKNIFFLVNLHDFLLEDEIESLYREADMLHVNLVSIDAREPRIKSSHEKIIIIDRDLCEILK